MRVCISPIDTVRHLARALRIQFIVIGRSRKSMSVLERNVLQNSR
jgi:hypothetical protein